MKGNASSNPAVRLFRLRPGEGRAWIPFLRGASFPVKEFIEGGLFAKNGIESLV